jgi:hypothetical protein
MTGMYEDKYECITSNDVFIGLISEGIENSRFTHASVIWDAKKRQEYLDKKMTNGLRRHLLYRNFVFVLSRGHPHSKNHRIVLPRCVVEKIRDEQGENPCQVLRVLHTRTHVCTPCLQALTAAGAVSQH